MADYAGLTDVDVHNAGEIVLVGDENNLSLPFWHVVLQLQLAGEYEAHRKIDQVWCEWDYEHNTVIVLTDPGPAGRRFTQNAQEVALACVFDY